MFEYESGKVTPAMEMAILREAMRGEMMAWLAREAAFTPRTAAEAETAVAAVRQAIRLRDPSLAVGPVAAAAASLGLTIAPAALPRVGRAMLGVLAELHEAEFAFESGATVEEATRALRNLHFGGRPPERLTPPVRLVDAVAKAVERAPTSGMTDKVRSTGELMLAFFGADAFLDDVFIKERMIAFLAWCMRLPNTHGKAHGRNKYEKVGKAVDKHAEIAAADAKDTALWAEIEARTELTWREKLVLAGQRFEPRLTDSMIEKHHARAKAIHETARDCLDWDAAPWQSCLKDWRNEMARQRKDASQDADTAPALLRVTKEKNRSAWSDERLAKLLNSTVYRGCFSEHRRWRPGPLIVRDHMYWAPLICLLCGMRPEEVLRLLKSDVLERDGFLCFRVEERPESGTKTESSERVVPLPETLLRLGFREWWHDSFYRPGPLLFPEATTSQRNGKASDSYGKRRKTLWAHLGITDWNEDGYALRHTFLTALDVVEASDSIRQAIAGHEQGEVINRHYTRTNLRKLKSYMDRLDFGIEIDEDDRRGYPVIRRCSLDDNRAVKVAARLFDGRLTRVIVTDPAVGERPVIRLDLTDAADQSDSVIRERTERAACRLHGLLSGRRLRIVNEAEPDVDDRRLRQAVMSFVALGSVASTRAAAR